MEEVIKDLEELIKDLIGSIEYEYWPGYCDEDREEAKELLRRLRKEAGVNNGSSQ
jgi:hypothetical protein